MLRRTERTIDAGRVGLSPAALSLVASVFILLFVFGCQPQSPDDDGPRLGREPSGPASEAPPATRDSAETQSQSPADAPPQATPAQPNDASRGAVSPAPGGRTEPEQQTGQARAELSPIEGSAVGGSVEFTARGEGVLAIEAQIRGLEPGTHALHIHELGDCSAPASSAGEHLNPAHAPHGAPNDPAAAHHAGDLGNITAGSEGVAEKDMEDKELELSGEFGVVGRAVIIHEGEDDLESQPSGDSGDPVACGVIRMVSITPVERA